MNAPRATAAPAPPGRATAAARHIGHRHLILLLAAVTATGPLAMQIFLPALPAVQATFGSSLTLTQLTFSAFIFAIGPAQLAYGPLADRFGRRPILIAGMLMYCIGSIACLVAGSIEWLIGARMLQAVGGGSGLVIARAILSDRYDADEMAGKLASVVLVMIVAPTIAPLIGGALSDWLGWRSIFALLSVLGMLATAAVLVWLPETLHVDTGAQRVPLRTGLAGLLRRPLFHAYALQASITLAMFYVFISTVPYLMEAVLGHSAREYGLWFMLLAAGYTAGNFTSSRLSRRLGINRMILAGSLAAIGGAAIMLALMVGHVWTPLALFLPMTLITFSNGLCSPNAQSGAVRQAPAHAGTASSLVGFQQQTIGALLVQLVSLLNHDSPLPLALFLTVVAILGVVCALAIRSLARRAQT